ncbi:MAG: peptidoglycan DD-metalloendopeptidase family protein [[Clostridium] leptum]
MKNLSESPVGKFLGKGFYAALAVCVLGAGAAAWVIAQNHRFFYQPAAGSLRYNPAKHRQRAGISKEQQVEQKVSNVSRPSSPPVSSSFGAGSVFAVPKNPYGYHFSNYGVSSFMLPVEDTVFNLFSGTELVKDETLDKWHTLNGIGIKAELGFRPGSSRWRCFHERGPMWGTVVEITHADDLVSRYCGLDEELSVVEGQAVSIADEIGRVGDTNLAETALEPHLHFELFEDGVRVDPLDRMGFYESDD